MPNLASPVLVADLSLPCQPAEGLIGDHISFGKMLREAQDVRPSQLCKERDDSLRAVRDHFLHGSNIRRAGTGSCQRLDESLVEFM